MDPNACLQRMEDAIDARDTREATEAALDLLEWILKDGYMPPIMKRQHQTLVDRLRLLIDETSFQTETTK